MHTRCVILEHFVCKSSYNSIGNFPSSPSPATLAPVSVVEVVEARSGGGGSVGILDPHILAPVVSGIACTLALLLCVGLLLSRGYV